MKAHSARRKNDLAVNTAKRSLKTLGPKIWNSLPARRQRFNALSKFYRIL